MASTVSVNPHDGRTVFSENPNLLGSDHKLVDIRKIHNPWKTRWDSTVGERVGKPSLAYRLDVLLVEGFPLFVIRWVLPHACLPCCSVGRVDCGAIKNSIPDHLPNPTPIRKSICGALPVTQARYKQETYAQTNKQNPIFHSGPSFIQQRRYPPSMPKPEPRMTRITPIQSSRYWRHSRLNYLATHGVGFQPEASACFLKCALVRKGSVRYIGSSAVVVRTRYKSPLDSRTRS